MTNLTEKEREILIEIEEEVLADIEMLENSYSILHELNNKKNLHKNDLPLDILNVFNRKTNRQQAMLEDIKELENEYGIQLMCQNDSE